VNKVLGAGEYGATLYAADGIPNEGVVDLQDGITNSLVWDSYTYTWDLAIRPGTTPAAASTSDTSPKEQSPVSKQAWLAAFNGGDPPPDTPG
jgi:hypothetical protein